MARPRRIPSDEEIEAALRRVAIMIFRREFERAYDAARADLRGAVAHVQKAATKTKGDTK